MAKLSGVKCLGVGWGREYEKGKEKVKTKDWIAKLCNVDEDTGMVLGNGFIELKVSAEQLQESPQWMDNLLEIKINSDFRQPFNGAPVSLEGQVVKFAKFVVVAPKTASMEVPAVKPPKAA